MKKKIIFFTALTLSGLMAAGCGNGATDDSVTQDTQNTQKQDDNTVTSDTQTQVNNGDAEIVSGVFYNFDLNNKILMTDSADYVTSDGKIIKDQDKRTTYSSYYMPDHISSDYMPDFIDIDDSGKNEYRFQGQLIADGKSYIFIREVEHSFQGDIIKDSIYTSNGKKVFEIPCDHSASATIIFENEVHLNYGPAFSSGSGYFIVKTPVDDHVGEDTLYKIEDGEVKKIDSLRFTYIDERYRSIILANDGYYIYRYDPVDGSTVMEIRKDGVTITDFEEWGSGKFESSNGYILLGNVIYDENGKKLCEVMDDNIDGDINLLQGENPNGYISYIQNDHICVRDSSGELLFEPIYLNSENDAEENFTYVYNDYFINENGRIYDKDGNLVFTPDGYDIDETDNYPRVIGLYDNKIFYNGYYKNGGGLWYFDFNNMTDRCIVNQK